MSLYTTKARFFIEEFKYACSHVLSGAQPAIDRDGDAICFLCLREGKFRRPELYEIVPAAVIPGFAGRWATTIKAGV